MVTAGDPNMPKILPVREVNRTGETNNLLASAISNKELAKFIRTRAVNEPMGSYEFHLLTEAAERLERNS